MGDPVSGPEFNGDESRITWESVQSYLDELVSRKYSPGTIDSYQRGLTKFFAWLPEDKVLCKGDMDRFQGDLLEQGYMPRTVNLLCSSVNGFLEFVGLREFQSTTQLPVGAEETPRELSRGEYLRLLSAARSLGKKRAYLLVKIFATTGLTVQELPSLTVEAVVAGYLVVYPSGVKRTIRISPCVQKELMDYIRQSGLREGPVFLGRNGKPIRRTVVTELIQSLSLDAKVAPEKCNPRYLHKLYSATREKILANLAELVDQTYDKLLEDEQMSTDWKEETYCAENYPSAF